MNHCPGHERMHAGATTCEALVMTLSLDTPQQALDHGQGALLLSPRDVLVQQENKQIIGAKVESLLEIVDEGLCFRGRGVEKPFLFVANGFPCLRSSKILRELSACSTVQCGLALKLLSPTG